MWTRSPKGSAPMARAGLSRPRPCRPSCQSDRDGKKNARFSIMKEHNGIIVLRHGRQIDVVSKCPWTTFVNYDRNHKLELDFEPTLDKEFSVTTSKQQIVPTERIWEILHQSGVYAAIEAMRARSKKARADLKAEADRIATEQKRASERAMEEAERFKPRRPMTQEEKDGAEQEKQK